MMSGAQSTVSVVVPCLNRAAFLVPTIESILGQDYPSIECIVMDGGSTDGTVEILRRYGDRIKWISERDSGAADAINKGWKMSKGGILAWLNADDVWVVPDAVSEAVAYLQARPEVDVVYGDCGKIDPLGNWVGMSYLHEWDLEYAVEHCDHCIPQPAAFMRRSVVEKVGWLDTHFIIMDCDLWYRIGLVGTIKHIPVLLAHARRHPSFWHSKSHIVADDCVRIIGKVLNNPALPAKFAAIRRRTISNAHLRAMDYAWIGRRWAAILRHALRACVADPTNAVSVYGSLRRYAHLAAREDARFIWAVILLEPPYFVWRPLRNLKRLATDWQDSPRADLAGDRDIEWSWVASHMPSGPGEALDFGPGASHLSLIAAQRGFNVTAVDLQVPAGVHSRPRVRFVQGDLLTVALPAEHFDLVINCSTVEHVGLTGRYGVCEQRPDGDLEAMARLRGLIKPGAVMLLTLPVGRDAVLAPWHRVYGPERLPRLLEGYSVQKEEYWRKDSRNNWTLTSRRNALAWGARRGLYGLGCFVLRRVAT
jgi:glycosyltransferase involved in cell wall biosynthesis/2-polyprenyl-3-methyl-5-hydroxy-6-metoxy-1,4-benzoquinol methylase